MTARVTRHHAWQLLRFGISGGATVAADYGMFALLYYLGVPLFMATAASLATGFGVSFTLNRLWVFEAGKQKGAVGGRQQLLRYVSLFLVNTIIAYFFIAALKDQGMDAYWAKVVSMVFITTWNFFIYRKFIFHQA